MSSLEGALADYLATRRSLGYKLEQAEQLLRQFLAYLDERGADTVTTEHALGWAKLPGGSTSWLAHRLSAVRGFAVYLKTIDPACEVPAAEFMPGRSRRAVPYLYSRAEVAALIEATAMLKTSHRTATFSTLVGLLSVTGMRIGEAIALDRGDIAWRSGLLVVRNTKFGKSRELPLHASTTETLRRYLRRRDRPPRPEGTEAVFVSTVGTRLHYCNVQSTYARLLARAGIKPRSVRCRPRLHDLRHSFAVQTILDGYRAGDGDVGPRLALLSTYLGHVDPAETYWYLSAAPELMEQAAARLERHLGGSR